MGYIATHISNLIYCYYNNDRLYLLLMNLRDLQYLVAVAEHLHFGKAAKAVHVSQPTLSMQLKKLEETLGVQLFERTNKHVMLTAIGQEMVTRAQRILNESEQLLHAARAARDPEAGTLRLGIFPTLAPYLLPRLMPLLSHHFPRLRLQLVEERTPDGHRWQVRPTSVPGWDVALPAKNPRGPYATAQGSARYVIGSSPH